MKDFAAGVGTHPRTIARWERGETQPSAAQWSKAVAFLLPRVPAEASELARAARVPVALAAAPPPIDAKLIEDALLRAADMLDVSPRRVRAAVRELAKATAEARGSLEDLEHAMAFPSGAGYEIGMEGSACRSS